ncbi:EC42 protein [Colletotrichum asianum]|uniref:EC42 protein n=1 Tax=Colletotrichum asianum TaxID=702518 RepID=A0A8H3W4F2_9PEZI|nr:EC42 protein [Colletotrichum asianum]
MKFDQAIAALVSLLAVPTFAQIAPGTCQREIVGCAGSEDCSTKASPGGFPCPAGSVQKDADCWIATSAGGVASSVRS